MSSQLSANQLSILLIEPFEVQRKVITRHLAEAGVATLRRLLATILDK